MNKKITSSALAALMIAGSTSFSAFAAMSNGTVVIGNKAFDLAYANDPAHAAEITNAIVAGGAVYVKDFQGNWIDNTTGKTVEASVIPAVTYKSADKEVKFDAADKDAVATSFGVTAIGAKKIKVTFAGAVDTTKAVVSVKKGTVAVNTDSIEFATDKLSATITTTTKLTAGDYTVSVSGLSDKAMTATVTTTDEKVSKINIASAKAPRLATDATKALVAYEVLNQYGEKLTGQSISWTISTGVNVINENTTKGTFEIKAANGAEFIPGAVVYITGVQATSGTVVNGQVEIALASQADSVTFKGVYDTTKAKLVDLPAGFADSRYVLLFKVNDQYGNAMSSPDLTKLVFTSNNPLYVNSTSFVATTDVTIDDVAYKAVTLTPGTAATNGGSVTIQAISTITGKISTFTTKAEALGSVKSFTMSAPTKMVAEGETVEIPFAAVDQYGNAVTNYDSLVSSVKVSPDYTPATTTTTAAGIKFVKQDDGSGKLKYTAPATGATDKVDLPVYITSVVTNGGNFSSVMLSVKDAAKPTAIVGMDSTVVTSIAKGNTKDIKAKDLIIQDQYGRTIADDDVIAWLDATSANSIVVESDDAATTPFTVKLDGLGSDSNKQIISASATTGYKVTLAAQSVKAATEALTFTLATGDNGTGLVTASAKTITFTKVEQSSYTSFEVADLGTMYNDADATTTAAITFNKTLKVYGVKADGTKVILPAADYNVSTNGKLVVTSNVVSDVTSAGYVATDFKDASGNYKDVKVNVLVTVNDANGAAASILEKELLISNKAPRVATIAVNTDEVEDGKAIIKTAKTSNADLRTFIDATELKDQYGVVIAENPVITITGLTKVDGSTLAVTSNGTVDAAISGAKMGDKFTATYKYASGEKVVIVFTVGL